MAFGQRELMTPLGIEEGSWDWTRDRPATSAASTACR